MTPKVKIFEMSFQIPQRDTGRCEVAERSSGLPHKKLGFRGTRPNPHFAQNGRIAPKIPWMLSPLYMSTYTEYGPDRLRFAGLIPVRLIFRPQLTIIRISSLS